MLILSFGSGFDMENRSPASLPVAATRRGQPIINLATARALFDKHLAQYQADPKAAESLLKVGIAPLPEAAAQPELAAWTMVANLVMNLDEAVTKE